MGRVGSAPQQEDESLRANHHGDCLASSLVLTQGSLLLSRSLSLMGSWWGVKMLRSALRAYFPCLALAPRSRFKQLLGLTLIGPFSPYTQGDTLVWMGTEIWRRERWTGEEDSRHRNGRRQRLMSKL